MIYDAYEICQEAEHKSK